MASPRRAVTVVLAVICALIAVALSACSTPLSRAGDTELAASVQQTADEAMAAALTATLVPLDMQATVGSSAFVDCLPFGTKYSARLTLAGSFLGDPDVAAETEAVAQAAEEIGFDLQEPVEPQTVVGEMPIEAGGDSVDLVLVLRAPLRRAEVRPYVEVGLRNLTVSSRCFAVPNDVQEEVGTRDYADLVPTERVYEPSS